MPNANLEDIRAKIERLHGGDERQLEVIFSDSMRLIVEAPAGYGKTTTMISRIAYLYASGKIPNPKRILGLTFSVNAALKVKRDVAEKLPTLLGIQNSPVILSEKVTVTNYHGFCKGILKKYGYLIADTLRKDINLIKAVEDSKISERPELRTALTPTETEQLCIIETSIKKSQMPDALTIHNYNEIIIKKLLPLEYITHNAVILFVLEIFERFPEVLKFYQRYYPLIVIDEFQDTNCIAWKLLEQIIISDRTQLVFLGDPLQRIYGFIGALPDIMNIVAGKYNMTRVTLSQNYRFRNNPEMLKLDKNIRENAKAAFEPTIADSDIARLPAFWGSTQQGEAQKVVAKVQSLIADNTVRLTILFRARGRNVEIVEEELSSHDVPYFFGMFKEDDPEYVDFHIKCQDMFVSKFGKSKAITHKTLRTFSESVKTVYASASGKTINSLLRLLDALVDKVSVDYADLLSEDKYNLLLDIFENRQITQAMEYVDAQVILSTVHGAKGLEWDYVFLADLERWIFPSFVCNECPNKYATAIKCRCQLPSSIPADFQEKALDEFSVFYVGVTRARKQVFISASATRYNANGEEKQSNFSCFSSINGVSLINAESTTTAS